MDVSPSIATPVAMPRRPRLKRTLRKLGFWLSVLVIVSPAILVFLWMLSLSLMDPASSSGCSVRYSSYLLGSQ